MSKYLLQELFNQDLYVPNQDFFKQIYEITILQNTINLQSSSLVENNNYINIQIKI